jgi:hypothetical protein
MNKSISQRYGSGDLDLDPHQNVTRILNTILKQANRVLLEVHCKKD